METAMATVGAVLVVAFPAFLALGRSYTRRHRPLWPDVEPLGTSKGAHEADR